MKKLFYLSLIVLGITFISCEEEELICEIIIENTVEGSWSMTEAMLGWGGYQTFEMNELVWTFNDNQLFIYFEDSLELNSSIPYSSANNAAYNYTANDSTIVIDEVGYNLSVNETELIIHQNPWSDGIQLNFTRN
jgi:hypothetical protein